MGFQRGSLSNKSGVHIETITIASIATGWLIALVNCTRKICMMIVGNAQIQTLCLLDEVRSHEWLEEV